MIDMSYEDLKESSLRTASQASPQGSHQASASQGHRLAGYGQLQTPLSRSRHQLLRARRVRMLLLLCLHHQARFLYN